ncbi:MAG: hypothetical protein ABIB04_01535 [Patescibacteria group bacterium]
MSERPPKLNSPDDDFVFVTSTEKFSHIYEWDKFWNPKMIKQCKRLFERLGWNQRSDFENQATAIKQAFYSAFESDHNEVVESLNKDEDRKKVRNLGPAIERGLKVDLPVAARNIFFGRRPQAFSPLELGTLLEQMIGYKESQK